MNRPDVVHTIGGSDFGFCDTCAPQYPFDGLSDASSEKRYYNVADSDWLRIMDSIMTCSDQPVALPLYRDPVYALRVSGSQVQEKAMVFLASAPVDALASFIFTNVADPTLPASKYYGEDLGNRSILRDIKVHVDRLPYFDADLEPRRREIVSEEEYNALTGKYLGRDGVLDYGTNLRYVYRKDLASTGFLIHPIGYELTARWLSDHMGYAQAYQIFLERSLGVLRSVEENGVVQHNLVFSDGFDEVSFAAALSNTPPPILDDPKPKGSKGAAVNSVMEVYPIFSQSQRAADPDEPERPAIGYVPDPITLNESSRPIRYIGQPVVTMKAGAPMMAMFSKYETRRETRSKLIPTPGHEGGEGVDRVTPFIYYSLERCGLPAVLGRRISIISDDSGARVGIKVGAASYYYGTHLFLSGMYANRHDMTAVLTLENKPTRFYLYTQKEGPLWTSNAILSGVLAK